MWQNCEIKNIDRSFLNRVALKFLKDEDLAEDAMAEIFSRLPKILNKFSEKANLNTYLYRVVVNKCLDIIKSKKRELKKIANLKDVTQLHHTDREIETEWAVNEAIAELNIDYRLPIILVELQNYDYQSAALELKIPITTFKTRIFRARKQLLEILNKRGVSL